MLFYSFLYETFSLYLTKLSKPNRSLSFFSCFVFVFEKELYSSKVFKASTAQAGYDCCGNVASKKKKAAFNLRLLTS